MNSGQSLLQRQFVVLLGFIEKTSVFVSIQHFVVSLNTLLHLLRLKKLIFVLVFVVSFVYFGFEGLILLLLVEDVVLRPGV